MASAPGADVTRRVLWVLAIVGAVVTAAGFMWLVTTFPFAFSGVQYRMVPVVGYGVLAMIVLPLAVAALIWRLRSPLAGFMAALAAVAAG